MLLPTPGLAIHSSTPAALRRLIGDGVVSPDDYEALPAADRFALDSDSGDERVIDRLVDLGLLTQYQASRTRAGRLHGLILGNYRVLEKIGTGGMGIVYRAEHCRLRQIVAVKALHPSPEQNPRMLARFFREARAVANLRHLNIVAAIDAGEEPASGPDSPALPYFVMEYIPGKNLELLAAEASMPVGFACHLIHQIADALIEAHRHGLVHRDIKPSNVLITPDGQAKLLDFGLARVPSQDRLTRTGAQLGTIGFMAPEQADDAHSADARADIFGLGCTLYFALTGQAPFANLASASSGPRPAAGRLRSDVSAGLDGILARMLAPNPDDRYPSAEAVMRALLPYLPAARTPVKQVRSFARQTPLPGEVKPFLPSAESTPAESSPCRVLIVDDQPDIRRLCRMALQAEGLSCDEAGTGPDAVTLAGRAAYDLVLLDVDLPGFSGEEVLRRLRRTPPGPYLKVIMFSGNASGDDLSRILLAGADDFVTKPFSVVQLRARVKTALRLKDAQDRAEQLTRDLLAVNSEMEQTVLDRDGELIRARNGLVLALAKLVEHRSAETGSHLLRLQRYCRVLAEEAAAAPAFAQLVDPNFVRMIEDCAPLHDIGKAALPDHILNKPGPLDAQERMLMQTHTSIGADTLRAVTRQYPFATAFLHMAIDIARSHHEKWDGSGYPDRMSGDQIPLAARMVAVADVYDALRAKRVYKPSLSHNTAVMTMTDASPGHFDPALLELFHKCGDRFDRIFREYID